MTKMIVFVFICFALMSGCSNRPQQGDNEALSPTVDETLILNENIDADIEWQSKAVLIKFFDSLNQGDYEKAVELFGGSYDVLQGYNPDINPSDHTGLLQAGCRFNGLMCLPILDSKLIQVNDQKEFIYEVSFKNPDGTLFELGPCCGASEEIMPTVSNFTIHVVCETWDTCQVIDLPPYVP
jgi:hypothetical protein